VTGISARIAAVLRRTLRMFVDRPRAALWTTLALTCALLAAAVAGTAALAVDRVHEKAASAPASSPIKPTNAGVVVYLGDKVTDARAKELVEQLRWLTGVERVELVSRAESARRLVAALGSSASLLDGVDLESLPASVEITLAPGVRDVVAMSPIVRELRGTPGVADLVIEDTPTDRSESAMATVQTIAWTAASVFAILALITALASIRLRLDLDRHEYRVIDLLGGGAGYTVVPTALAGALQGLVAALLAIALLAIGIQIYGDGLPVEVALPGAFAMLGFLGTGAAIGLIGGGLAATATPAARVTAG
jgi:cell division protein FtsX